MTRSGSVGRRNYSGRPRRTVIRDCLKRLGKTDLPQGVEIAHGQRGRRPCADNPATRLQGEEGLLPDGGPEPAQGREGGRLCLRRLHGGAALGGDPAGQAHPGHPPGGPGPCGPHGERGRWCSSTAVPTAECTPEYLHAVRLHGVLLRPACPGPSGEPQGGPAEHRGGGEQGHWSCNSRPTPC